MGSCVEVVVRIRDSPAVLGGLISCIKGGTVGQEVLRLSRALMASLSIVIVQKAVGRVGWWWSEWCV